MSRAAPPGPDPVTPGPPSGRHPNISPTKADQAIVTEDDTPVGTGREDTAEAWAARIAPHLTAAADAIVAAGRELIEAKAAVPHGAFGACVELLGLTPSTARKFMAIANNPAITNRSQGSDLPGSWTTLYELSRLDPDELTTVTVTTTRTEAKALTAEPTASPLAPVSPAARVRQAELQGWLRRLEVITADLRLVEALVKAKQRGLTLERRDELLNAIYSIYNECARMVVGINPDGGSMSIPEDFEWFEGYA